MKATHYMQPTTRGEWNPMNLTSGRRWLTRLATAALFALSGVAMAQTVTITAPTNGSSSPVNTAINLAATTTGSGFGRVRFKQNGTVISFGDTSAPYTETYTPTSTGTYVFVAEAMIGQSVLATSTSVTVTVTSGGGSNVAPTVSLTAPTNGASLTAPASFNLTATASDSDGTITNVKFYADGNLLSTDSNSPYAGTFASSDIGTHSLTAVATDNGGATTTSTAVSVSVTSAGGVVVVGACRRHAATSTTSTTACARPSIRSPARRSWTMTLLATSPGPPTA
jgi:hypothetical protein